MCPRRERRVGRSDVLSVTCLAYHPLPWWLTPVCSVGHHSTSDDSFAYRPRQEVEDRKKVDNPIVRFRLFMESKGWWSKEEDDVTKERLKQEVMITFKRVEKLKRHELKQLFEDVYGGDEPWNLVSSFCPIFLLYTNIIAKAEQREELSRLLRKYGADWGPWKQELDKFRGEGKELVDH
jgi:2-oxoisovalerate dehydrogenase E1 component alpha subunit